MKQDCVFEKLISQN